MWLTTDWAHTVIPQSKDVTKKIMSDEQNRATNRSNQKIIKKYAKEKKNRKE